MESISFAVRSALVALLVCVIVFGAPIRRSVRARLYTRGRSTVLKKTKADLPEEPGSLRFGNSWLPKRAATSHFLVIGTTGSGKTNIQRLLMREPLRAIRQGTDHRAVVFDAKQDTAAYLTQIGVDCPIVSLNPFAESTDRVRAVAWDIAADITSPARAQNLAASLIPMPQGGGQNQYFLDAARQIVIAVVESMIRHAGTTWTFGDLVLTCLNEERIKQVLSRDQAGRDVLDGFFRDDRVAYQVFTTVCSRLSYFRPVAALWQRTGEREKLSVRRWLRTESILLLGSNATARTSLDSINEQIFRVMVEEIDIQSNCANRRTYVWLDEARLAGPLLKPDLLPFLAVKGRSKGVSIVLAFQDMEGLREAAGPRVADELVAQFSNQAFLRMQTEASAKFAASQCGQYETLEHYTSDSSSFSSSISTQRVIRDAVLPVEMMQIPPSSPQTGVTGYFLSPEFGAERSTVPPGDVAPVVVAPEREQEYALSQKPEGAQWLREWAPEDLGRLALTLENELAPGNGDQKPTRKHLNLNRNSRLGQLRVPTI